MLSINGDIFPGFWVNWLLLGTKWLLSNAMELLLCVDKAIIYHRSLYLLLKTRDPKHPSYWYPVGNGMSSKTHIAKNLHLLESRRRPYGGERDLWNSSVSARHETKQKYRPWTQFGNPGRAKSLTRKLSQSDWVVSYLCPMTVFSVDTKKMNSLNQDLSFISIFLY